MQVIVEKATRMKQKKTEKKEEDIPLIDWAWKGYLAWYLHGYMAPKSNRLAIFDPGK